MFSVSLFVILLVDAASALVRVNFGVLLPEITLSPVAQGSCGRLGWAQAEQSLVTDEVARLFGDHWTVVEGDQADIDKHPAAVTAAEKSKVSAVRFKLSYNDTGCSDTYGPYAAMEIYYDRTGCRKATARGRSSSSSTDGKLAFESVVTEQIPSVDSDVAVFYGPCCKYALSPVGRYAKLWDVPVITSGGLTGAFSNRTSFPLLVRIVPPYSKLAAFIVELLSAYQWRHTSILFHENLGEDKAIGYSECSHTIDAVFKAIDPAENPAKWKRPGRPQHNVNGSDADEAAATGSTSPPFNTPHSEQLNEADYDNYDIDKIMQGLSQHARSK